MLFGQSLFRSVLERLEAEAEIEEETPGSFRVRGLGAGFVAEEIRDTAGDLGRGEALYREMTEGIAPASNVAGAGDLRAEEPAAPPAHLLRQTPEEVAADLALSPADGLAELAEKRRAFARLNHPDGIEERFRELATFRMKIANLLVDEAIRRLAG